MMKSRIVWWILALLLAGVFARLGFWQWHRAQEKRVQLAEVAQVMAHPQPVDLLAPVQAEFAWVRGQGRFEPSPIVLLDNQQREGKVGVQVYGVFVPSQDVGKRFLVDLGWQPMDAARDWPVVAVPQGEMEIRGLRAAPPSAGIRVGSAAGQTQKKDVRWLVTFIDTAELGKALGAPLQPWVVRLDPKLPVGYPRDLTLHSNALPPEKHLAYAVQWWGLSLTVLLTAVILTFRARNKGRAG